jgi:hypothetical protein
MISPLAIMTSWLLGMVIIYVCRHSLNDVFMGVLRRKGQDSETMRKEDETKANLYRGELNVQ